MSASIYFAGSICLFLVKKTFRSEIKFVRVIGLVVENVVANTITRQSRLNDWYIVKTIGP